MWRLIVIQLYSLFISIQATAVPPASDAAPQVHGPARVIEGLGAKHGYRYQVQFPSTQRKNRIVNRYQSADKDEDSDSSASTGATRLAMYAGGFQTVADPPQRTTLSTQLSRSNNSTYHSNQQYLLPSSTGYYEERETEVENDKNSMFLTLLQPNIYSSPKDDRDLLVREPAMYLPPKTFDNPVANKSEGYNYDKPNNQLTLPNENNNLEYFTNNPQWYPSVPMNSDDDSVEVFPPSTESQLATWVGENTKDRKPEAPVYPETFTNSLSPSNQEQPKLDFIKYNYDTYNSKTPLPSIKNEHESSFNAPYQYSSKSYRPEPEKSTEQMPQVTAMKNSKMVDKVNKNELKPARITSHSLETEIDDLSNTSLMVHFAGSVFSAEGLPHPSKETVFPVDYNFSYDLRGWPEMGHEETRADTTTRGRYWVGLPDGRLQVVEYTAGPQGFMPKVSYMSRGP